MDKNQQKQTNRDSRTMLTEFKDVSIHFFFLKYSAFERKQKFEN